MPKSIATVGIELAGTESSYLKIRSKSSLLDYDIVIFRPDYLQEFRDHQYLQGKPSFDDHESFLIKDFSDHWRRELIQAVAVGKTVIVVLSELQEVYLDTGERTYSGTGRNQKTTRHVSIHTNYSMVPLSVKPVNTHGQAMKLTQFGNDILAVYWKEFGSQSEYKVKINAELKDISVVTRSGDLPVGCVSRSSKSTGTLVLLPDVDFSREEFYDEVDRKTVWTEAAVHFATKMIHAVIELDRMLLASSDTTPEPEWARANKFVLFREDSLNSELLATVQQIEVAQNRKEVLVSDLLVAGKFRALLYENGRRLEDALVDSLRLMGFTAAKYQDGNSEFDVVFECPEGRLLGEAEGKDTKAINVEKLRQLAMNINEDLQRDEVLASAKGVLFGNGFRLSAPSERVCQFTEKCISAANISSTALVATSEMFTAVQYLLRNPDEAYAALCRVAFLTGVGLVHLPKPPGVGDELTDAVQLVLDS